ncbi:MAG: hypothetical protein KC561_09410 [Myxococcales bacterium]|nr:hypothetical protein [Myxococcales bacterium]
MRQGVLVVAPMMLFLVACSGAGSEEGDAVPASTWSVPVPAVKPRTLNESLAIIQSDPATGPSSLEAARTSAAVFDVGSDKLEPSHPSWQTLVRDVCGPRDGEKGLLADALAAGWNVTVTGYVDSTGPTGPGTRNEHLQDGRAATAKEELSRACSIPEGRALTARGGVAGDGAEARKVTVTYTRGPQAQGGS